MKNVPTLRNPTLPQSLPDVPSGPPDTADLAHISDPRPAVFRAMLVIALLFGGFGTWAATAPLDSGVVASGTLVMDGRRRLVQHPEGGVIAELLVGDGERVEKGQVLARLDPTRAAASHDILRGTYIAALAEDARLVAERDGTDPVFPDELLARQDDPVVARAMEDQNKLFAARKSAIEGQTGILTQQIGQARREIEGLSAQAAAGQQQTKFVQEELSGLRQLLAEGLVPKGRVLELEREFQQLRGTAGANDAAVARLESTIAQHELEILQLRRQRQEEVVALLRDNRARLLDARERLADARNVLEQIEVRAPIKGVVVNRVANTVGGVVRAGEVMMELVPTQERMVIEVQVNPADVDLISPGQRANVLFTAFSTSSTPALQGEVIKVSADRLVDQFTGLPFYQATINISDQQVARLGEGKTLQAGMPADVVIVAGERTMIGYIMKPLQESFRRAWQE